MSERNFEVQRPAIGTSGRARAGNVHIGHIKDVAAVLRLLDELREDLNEAKAPTAAIEAVDDLRVEARKPKPSKEVADHLLERLADRGLGERTKELQRAFGALF